MPQQASPTIQNHFQAGLKTEFTGLNFPENAATDTQNCVYSLIGDVTRRGGINYEVNGTQSALFGIGSVIARTSYRWLNAGGNGLTQILVVQAGQILNFYLSSSATTAAPLSTTKLNSVIDLGVFLSTGSDPNSLTIRGQECQYTSGNGFLFVYHPQCDPFYCTFNATNSVITATPINIQTRDFTGILEPNTPDNFRPNALSIEHQYNLQNQGWTSGPGWSATGTFSGGGTGIPTVGQNIVINISGQSSTSIVHVGNVIKVVISQAAGTGGNPHVNGTVFLTGTVISYASPFTQVSMAVATNSNPALNSLGSWSGGNFNSNPGQSLDLSLINQGFITTWVSQLGNYPSNADVWWLYKDTTGVFNPTGAVTAGVQPSNTASPKGYYVFSAFNQDRSGASGVSNLTPISTTARPSTGTFYQGRVFYAGVNASALASGDEPFYTWTENIYFSQIVTDARSFGKCYQENDPTSQNLFSILPSDGGQIIIPGCGAVYKLFALRFGVLVFAANGIWFISGSSGIGFTATDYTVTKISSIRAISGSSFIDVQGYPYFWNEEGLYKVSPSSQPGSAHSPDIQLEVENLTLGSILSYYEDIPLPSKAFARGDYDEIAYVVQWCFRSTPETDITNRYSYDTVLLYNTVTKAFYPYTLPTSSLSTIVDIKYILNPGGTGAPGAVLKYLTDIVASPFHLFTFSEENDFTNWVDFISENGVGYNYTSYLISGYTLPGQGLRKIQTPYAYVFSRNPGLNAYGIRAIWDYAGSATLGVIDDVSGKWSTRQVITNNQTDYTMIYRKIRLRGRGLAVQIRIDSQPGKPFDLIGWSVWNEVNQGI